MESLAKAAYAGCWSIYGHPNFRELEEAWRAIGPEQRRMWYNVAANVKKRIEEDESK